MEQLLLKQRKASEPQIEPVEQLGSKLRLFSHMDPANIFLDVPETKAEGLIRHAIDRATLALDLTPGSAEPGTLGPRMAHEQKEAAALSSDSASKNSTLGALAQW